MEELQQELTAIKTIKAQLELSLNKAEGEYVQYELLLQMVEDD